MDEEKGISGKVHFTQRGKGKKENYFPKNVQIHLQLQSTLNDGHQLAGGQPEVPPPAEHDLEERGGHAGQRHDDAGQGQVGHVHVARRAILLATWMWQERRGKSSVIHVDVNLNGFIFHAASFFIIVNKELFSLYFALAVTSDEATSTRRVHYSHFAIYFGPFWRKKREDVACLSGKTTLER